MNLECLFVICSFEVIVRESVGLGDMVKGRRNWNGFCEVLKRARWRAERKREPSAKRGIYGYASTMTHDVTIMTHQ